MRRADRPLLGIVLLLLAVLLLPVHRDFGAWARAIRTRHVRALYQHPHHYVVAFGITLIAFAFFNAELGIISTAWSYAILENLSSVE